MAKVNFLGQMGGSFKDSTKMIRERVRDVTTGQMAENTMECS